jgi:hypothetical protein
MTRDGEIQLVLHLGKKCLGGRRITIVIDAGGIDVGDLLVEATLREADFANLFQQALEIVFTQKHAVFHALFVQNIALDGKLAQNLGGPLTKLGSPYRIDPLPTEIMASRL